LYGWSMKKGLLLAILMALPSAVMAQNTPAGMTPAQAKRAEAYLHYSLARVHDQGEDWDESIKEYKKALEIVPNDANIYTSMAHTYLNQRNREEAIKAAQKAVEIDRDNLGAHRLLADVYIGLIQGSQNNNSRQQQTPPAVVRESFNKAIHEYEEIVRIDPRSRDGYLVLGQLYRLNDQPEKALELYRKFLGIEPGSEEGIVALATLSMETDHNAEAIDMLNDYLKGQPNSPRALELLGDAHLALGNADDAARAYKRAFQITNDDDLRNKLAQALYEDDQLEEAGKLYEEVLKEDLSSIPVMQRLGQIYRRQMKYTEAREIINRALRRSPNSAALRFDVVMIDRDEAKFEDAIKGLEGLLKDSERTSYTQEQKSGRISFYVQMAMISSLMTRYDQAISAFNNVRSLSDPSARGQVDMMIADTYKEAKDLDKAQATLESALRDSPNSKSLQIAYADLIASRGRLDEGIQILQKLSAGKEPDLDLLSAMTGIYEHAERFSDAQRVLDTAIKQFSDDKQVHFLQGALFERQKKIPEAEQAFRKALDLDKNNPSVLNYLGYMLADHGMKLDEALVMVKKAVDSDPINGAFLDSLGWVYYKMDNMPLAQQYLERAVAFASTNATMYDHLGDVYFKTGRYRDAQAAWTKGLPYAEDAEEAARMRQKLDQVRARAANQ
jgi:tetratricopeptide (TPR) repeat protein